MTVLPLAAPQRSQPAAPMLVPRPGLVERLRLATSRAPLTLVSAPPGAGKTALLRLWAAAETRPVVWDADAAGKGSVLVLDDCDGGSLARVLASLPEGAHVVLACRTDPPLRLALLRARGELEELRTRDLRFAPDEAAELVRRVAGVALADEEAELLIERFDGWAAGIYLAALQLRRSSDPTETVRELSAAHRYVADFLHETVLDPAPPELRRFLLETCTLEELTPASCDALLGRHDSAETLRTLARTLQFVRADGCVYRYHRVLSDLLRHEVGYAPAPAAAEPAPLGPAADALALLREGRAAAARELLLDVELADAAPEAAVAATAARSLASARLRLHAEAASFARSSVALAARHRVDDSLARAAQAVALADDGGGADPSAALPVRTCSGELTDAELRVARLLSTRLTQREIARELYLSLNTVKTHARSIYRKLGAASRGEAVAVARALNVI